MMVNMSIKNIVENIEEKMRSPRHQPWRSLYFAVITFVSCAAARPD